MTSPQPGFAPAMPPLPPPTPPPPPSEPWTRSSTDRVIAGVCGGLGRRLGVDPVILRVVIVVLSFFAGAGLVIYAALWLLMPLDQTGRSVLSEALGGTPADRTRSVLTAAALIAVGATAAIFALDGGFVPGFLIALCVIAVLLIVRRDEAAARPSYGQPTYGQPTYGQPMYGQPTYGQPTYGPVPASAATEPTVVTDPTTDPTVAIPMPSATTVGYPPSAATPYWDPPFDQPPPAAAYQSQQVGPPPPPRQRSYLGVLTLSAMFAVLGVMGVLDVGAGLAIPVAGYVVAALGVVAGGLVLGAWLGRSRGLIALGVILGLALGPAVLVDAVVGSDWRDWRNADNIRLAPRTTAELAPVYDYGAGSIRLDLTGLDFEGKELATVIDMGAGEVIVTVPADVDVTVTSDVVAGDLVLFDRETSGFDTSDSFTDLGADGLGGGTLDLSIDLGLGKVEVRRATS